MNSSPANATAANGTASRRRGTSRSATTIRYPDASGLRNVDTSRRRKCCSEPVLKMKFSGSPPVPW